MNEDAKLQMLGIYITRGWLQTKGEVDPDAEKYWLIRYDLVMIDGVAMKAND